MKDPAMLLTLDFTEAERRVLAWHFGEDHTMIDRDALAQAVDARIATAALDTARKAENAIRGLARRVAVEPAPGMPYAGIEKPHQDFACSDPAGRDHPKSKG